MKKSKTKSILIFGIGNSGREDDGLGWAFLDSIKPILPDNYTIEYRYQLQIEDAELITHFDEIVFVDAHMTSFKKGFVWEECLPKRGQSVSSHELVPETILFLASSIYKYQPKSYILGISGERFSLANNLSNTGKINLVLALCFFEENIIKYKNATIPYDSLD